MPLLGLMPLLPECSWCKPLEGTVCQCPQSGSCHCYKSVTYIGKQFMKCVNALSRAHAIATMLNGESYKPMNDVSMPSVGLMPLLQLADAYLQYQMTHKCQCPQSGSCHCYKEFLNCS